jgi:hypothetical protein
METDRAPRGIRAGDPATAGRIHRQKSGILLPAIPEMLALPGVQPDERASIRALMD